MEETKKYLSESQTNIKNHGQIFNERTNVNVKYLKMYTWNDSYVDDAVWGATRGWWLTGEMYVISSLRKIANGAAEG